MLDLEKEDNKKTSNWLDENPRHSYEDFLEQSGFYNFSDILRTFCKKLEEKNIYTNKDRYNILNLTEKNLIDKYNNIDNKLLKEIYNERLKLLKLVRKHDWDWSDIKSTLY